MEQKEIFTRIIDILKPYVREPAALDQVSEETHIIDDLKVNSARLVDVIIQAEDEFDIIIEDDDADTIRTVGDTVNVVAQKMSQAAA